MKRTMFLVSIVFVMVCAIIFSDNDGVRADVENGTCGPNLNWEYDTTTTVLKITGTGNMDNYHDMWVSPWNYYAMDITSVLISEGVTSIGDAAFGDCTSLTSVTIPDSVTYIGGYAFSFCRGLVAVTIPEGITSIEPGVFFECHGLDSVIIPKGVTSIGDAAFDGCMMLSSVVIPDSVTSIGAGAFKGTDLKSVEIPKGVTSIGDTAFSYCYSLTSVTIPDGITSIEPGVFSKCYGLDSVIIPKGVTSIGDAAFENCSSLTSVTIPDSVTIIGISTFFGCSELTSITIPESVTSIGGYAFGGCSLLAKITIEGTRNPLVENSAFEDSGGQALSKEAYGDSKNSSFKTASETAGYTWINKVVQMISVILPTSIRFYLDLTLPTVNQATSPNIMVTNNSNVNVDLSIVDVSDTNSVIATTMSNLTSKKALFAIKPKSTSYSTNAVLESDALKIGTQMYPVVNSIPANGGISDLNIFGRASTKGWKANDMFQFTTTFKVTAN